MGQMFIGTGCDSKFVDLTCAMLASIDDRGDVPDATIIVSAFDLTAQDRGRLRLSAGRMGANMRFLPVSPGSALVPAVPAFDFPFPMLGCLVAPKGVDVAGARMLLLDSDMIINASLRPLFEIDLEGHPMAAVKDMLVESELHARGRRYDPDYFNTGLLLIDIDMWNSRDIGDRAMRRLAAYPEKPEWPDQDALNDIIRGDWLRLDRRWNFAYCGEDRQWTYEEYSAAYIVHFSGAKPTECRDHPAVPLYDRQADRVMAQRGWGRIDDRRVDRTFLAAAYEVLLGREPEGAHVIPPALVHPPSTVIAGFLTSPEFRQAVLDPLASGKGLPKDRFPGCPTMFHKYWTADHLPLLPATVERVEAAKSWDALLTILVADARMMTLVDIPPVQAAA